MARKEDARLEEPAGGLPPAVRWGGIELLRDPQPLQLHPRIERVLRMLHHNLPARERLSLERLAAVAGLSPSRFMHVFTRSMGMPLRRYILWLRLRRAAHALAKGASATDAAHAAGFADTAHMSRTFRRILGTTPRRFALRALPRRGRPPES